MIMNYKKILIIFTIVVVALIVVISGISIFMKMVFSGWSNGTISQYEEEKQTTYGDKFIVQYEKRNFPELETTIRVKDYNSKEIILYFIIPGKFYESNILPIINTSDVRCYEFYNNFILYKVGNCKFEGCKFDKLDNNVNPNFIKVSKSLVNTGEWKWIKSCGKLLLNAGDNDVKKLFQRYASGKFTSDELNLNKNSSVSKEDIIMFSQQLLSEY